MDDVDDLFTYVDVMALELHDVLQDTEQYVLSRCNTGERQVLEVLCMSRPRFVYQG